MVAIKTLLFALGVSASVVRRATPTDVYNDLTVVDSRIKALQTQLSNWDGSASKILPVQSAVDNLLASIQTASSDAASSAQANDADSNKIIGYVNNPITPDIKTAVDLLISKRSQVYATNATPRVRTDLNQLKGNTTALANNLVQKASSNTKSAASSASSSVLAQIQRAIDSFAPATP